MKNFMKRRTLLRSLTSIMAISALSAAAAAAAAAAVEAQRFGGFYYTGQQTLPLAGQNRVCKVYGFNFAKFNRATSKILDAKFANDRICQTYAGKWNGDCCTVAYTDGQTNAARQPAPAQPTAPTRPQRRTR